jgi:parallel beta helix pectate lyase-like protein
MAYTLSGRVQSRLAAVLLPLLAACVLSVALPAWWPLELTGLMIGVGLALDLVYHRLFDYQPGWLAVPLGLAELGAVVVLARTLEIGAPLVPALVFFGASWALAQVLAHAGLPLLRLSYADEGGELGWIGAGLAVATLAVFGTAGVYAWSQLPPTVHLSAGVYQGPIVITERQHLVGERGTVVRGGIIVRADDVVVRNVATVGGDYGIEVDRARRVVLDHVRVVGAAVDGIHVRQSTVHIRDCRVDSPGRWTQGIDVSFSYGMGMSMIEGCTVVGGMQGIVVDSAEADIHRNRVSTTLYQAIAMTEMSMGMVSENEVAGAVGAGIACVDQSMCMIEDNHVSGTKPDRSTPGIERQAGYGIVSDYKAEAELTDNELVGNAGRVGVFAGATVTTPD